MGIDIVCDIGSNFKGLPDEPLERSWQRTLRTLDFIKAARAQVGKFQMLDADGMYPAGSKEHALVKDYELPREWLPRLKEACDAVSLEFMCTAFIPEHVPLIDPYVQRHKIASFEARRPDLLAACRATDKPLIVSTGTLSQREVWDLDALLLPRDTMLYCVSKYPAETIDYDLSVLGNLTDEREPVRLGLSDHTSPRTATAAVLAVALGASLIETHVTLHSNQGSPDAHFARGPAGTLHLYVKAIREAEAMMGDGIKRPREGELTQYRWSPVTGKRGVVS